MWKPQFASTIFIIIPVTYWRPLWVCAPGSSSWLDPVCNGGGGGGGEGRGGGGQEQDDDDDDYYDDGDDDDDNDDNDNPKQYIL